jgi:nicotinate-nucleotide--dimethylbenzimidazole phosphoribosyltransferase
LAEPVKSGHETARLAAECRQRAMTKPPGALGRLETLAIRLAALQSAAKPCVDPVHVAVFAGDHGVAAERVSAFPQSVTAEMVRNFAQGGAAISVLARTLGAELTVFNLGTVAALENLAGVINRRLGAGTVNFVTAAAMEKEQLRDALAVGREAVERASASRARLLIAGEMGIANTTSAAALAAALLAEPPSVLAGPGTGLDAAGVQWKASVIQRALTLHQPYLADPYECLRRLGGFEIAALTGAYIAAAQRGLVVLVDGFIATVAALLATRLRTGVREWLLYAHRSAEPGHLRVLAALDAEPLLDLGMRLGEGSGAALAVPILRLACALHNEMATFADAGISEREA